ncbi:MAG: enoyl-CoA hydratase/isomerase family protein [Chloroflexi bacterium]|nr:enoyl-CoA hydratase/isomerase family protein [Chloroflexota bacterium]
MIDQPPAAYYEVKDGVAHIHLDRPEKINAFNVQMRDDLWEILAALHIDSEIEAVVLSGNGERGFCAGADLTEFGTTPSRVVAREARYLRDVWKLLRELAVPTIAALHGYVLGDGIEMALCCDLRVAAGGAVFGAPEVSLGMIPFAAGSQTLPRTVGTSRALDFLLTSRRFGAEEALRIGLIQRVVPPGQHLVAAYELVTQMRGQAGSASGRRVRRTLKEALRRGGDLSLPAALERERTLAATVLWDAVRPSGRAS